MWVNSRCAIAAWLECFQEKPRTVSEWTGLPGEESVTRFERSNGLDTALYKTIPFFHVERSSSVVECRTRNRESPGSNPLCYRFEVWAFSFTSRRPSRLSCINEYLAIDSGGNVSDLVLARNCCLARMLPGEAENGVGMNRSVR